MFKILAVTHTMDMQFECLPHYSPHNMKSCYCISRLYIIHHSLCDKIHWWMKIPCIGTKVLKLFPFFNFFLYFCWYCQSLVMQTPWHFSYHQSNAIRMRQNNTRIRFGKLGSTIGPYPTFLPFFLSGLQIFLFFKAENNNRNGKIWTLMLKFGKKKENPDGLAAMQYQICSYPNLIVKHTYLQEWMKYRCLLFYTETPCRFQVTATPD